VSAASGGRSASGDALDAAIAGPKARAGRGRAFNETDREPFFADAGATL
jgi:hypothetical protein